MRENAGGERCLPGVGDKDVSRVVFGPEARAELYGTSLCERRHGLAQALEHRAVPGDRATFLLNVLEVGSHLDVHGLSCLLKKMPGMDCLSQALEGKGNQNAESHNGDVDKKVLETVHGAFGRVDLHGPECSVTVRANVHGMRAVRITMQTAFLETRRMLLASLREEVLEANLELVKRGLVLYTFGNASGIDRQQGLVVIKPSGVDYDDLRPEHMVVTDLEGVVVDGTLKPSSDLDTHTLLYREFWEIGAVVHTHSEFATSFAQAGLPIPAFGTTHADYFYGPIPCTEPLSEDAIGGRYVHETGVAIVRRFRGLASAIAGNVASAGGGIDRSSTLALGGNSAGSAARTSAVDRSQAIDPLAVPACLVAGHAPFVWGRTAKEAAHNAVVLEAVAKMAYRTLTLKSEAEAVSQALLDRHYFRKHGVAATYGQATQEM